jgi:hypothetical protein
MVFRAVEQSASIETGPPMLRAVGILVCFGVFGIDSVAQAQVGGWVSANGTFYIPAPRHMLQRVVFPFHPGDPRYRQGDAQHNFRYTLKGKPSFDIGGGIRFGHLGVGIAMTRYSDNEIAEISVSVPALIAAGNNTAGAIADTQDSLRHEEATLHVDVRYIWNPRHASVAAFVGPSYFTWTQETITDVGVRETVSTLPRLYSISIVDYGTRTLRVRKWGYNAGVDVSYHFSEKVGVGAIMRFAFADASDAGLETLLKGDRRIAEPPQPLTIGGLHVGAGIRFRI